MSATLFPGEQFSSEENQKDYFALFMIFGYANGTDSEEDISYYLSDNANYNNNPENSFFLLLFRKLIFDPFK